MSHAPLHGTRYQCRLCNATADVWATEPNKTSGYADHPEGWTRDFGYHFCPAHAPVLADYLAALDTWNAAHRATRIRLYKPPQEAEAQWRRDHPMPTPPWATTKE